MAVLAAAGAYAAIPDSNGVIRGCYQKVEGLLRVIDPATETCRTSEVAIAWSQTGPQGLQGPQGPQGPQGQKGDPGTSGVSGWERVSNDVFVPKGPNQAFSVSATCPVGKRVLGGGYSVGHREGSDEVLYNGPLDISSGSTWLVVAQQDEDVGFGLFAYAICASVGP